MAEKDKKYDAKRAGTRFRNWATVLYPESMSKDYREIIAKAGIQALLSPLHDADKNPNGENKKPHYHLIIMFNNPATQSKAQDIITDLKGVGCEHVKEIRGYARYLCHLDNPEKAQYNVGDVVKFGGVDYVGIISLPTDKYDMVAEMIDFCDKYSIYSFAMLMRYCKTYRRDWFRVLCDSCARIITEYLKSKQWETTEIANGNLQDVPLENIAICEGLKEKEKESDSQ